MSEPKKRRSEWIVWLVPLMFLLAYPAAYLVLLSPWPLKWTDGRTNYYERYFDSPGINEFCRKAFRPIHAIDRAIRPDYWCSPETDEGFHKLELEHLPLRSTMTVIQADGSEEATK